MSPLSCLACPVRWNGAVGAAAKLSEKMGQEEKKISE